MKQIATNATKHKLPEAAIEQAQNTLIACISFFAAMEEYKGEIFQLYIVQKKTLKQVIAILKQEHDIEVS